jgi:hypothetical protein
LSVESLKSSKLGKIIVKLVKEPPAPGERSVSQISTHAVSVRDSANRARSQPCNQCLRVCRIITTCLSQRKLHVSNSCLISVLPKCAAIKDMASNLERRWRQLVETAQKQAENTQTEGGSRQFVAPVNKRSSIHAFQTRSLKSENLSNSHPQKRHHLQKRPPWRLLLPRRSQRR